MTVLKCLLWAAIFSLVTLLILMRPALAAGKVALSTTFDSRVEVGTHGKPPAINNGTTAASVVQVGTEREIAHCKNAFIRESSAHSIAAAQPEQPSVAGPTDFDAVAKFVISVNVESNGGGYRTCDACVLTCIGLHPHDTAAVGTASVSSRTVIPAPVDLTVPAFKVQLHRTVTGISANALAISIEDGEGHLVVTDPKDDQPVQLEAALGRTYVILSRLQASASDTGTCCKTSSSGMAEIEISVAPGDVNVERAKELRRPGSLAPRMIQGATEKGFPQVGMIVRGEHFVCTGTLVGTKTVLTAAHCLAGSPYAYTEYAFRVGQSFLDSGARNYSVSDATYPNATDSGYAFDRIIYADDIALLYLAEQPNDPSSHLPLAPLSLYLPPNNAGLDPLRPTQLHFVGFGYDKPDPDPAKEIPLGVVQRRSLDMSISDASSRVFKNQDEPHNTCYGDSGGPALRLDVQPAQVVGVISGGDIPCRDYGNNTRIDFYGPWLRDKIH